MYSLFCFRTAIPDMTTSRIIVSLFFALATSVTVFSDEAFDFFVEMCRHSSYNPAEISSFQAELRVVSRAIYPDSDAAAFAQGIDKSVEGFRVSEEEKQRIREAYEEIHRKMYSGEEKSDCIKVFVRNSAAPIGLEDVLVYVKHEWDNRPASVFQVGTQKVSVAADGTLIPIGTKAQVAMIQFPHSTVVDAARSFNNSGYHLLGRAATPKTSWSLGELLLRDEDSNFVISDASRATFKRDCVKYGITFSLSRERVKYEEDHSAYVLEIYEKGRLCEQFWCDPDRGFICPKTLTFSPTDGSESQKLVSENFILDAYSGKWFPEKVTQSAQRGTKPNVTVYYNEVHVVPGTLILNQPIPDSVFALTVPEKTRVDDVRRDDNDKITFYANKTGTLDLSTVENKSLDGLEWLVPQEVVQYYPLPIEPAFFTWTRIIFLAAGIIMIILGLILHFYRK